MALAGCSGDDGDDSDGGDGSGGSGGGSGGDGGGGSDDLLSVIIPIQGGSNQVPTESMANQYSAETYNNRIGVYTNDPLGMFSAFAPQENEGGPIMGCMAEDWGMVDDNSALEISIWEEYGWTDGEDITSEDWYTKLKMEELFGLGLMEDTVDNIEIVDNYTFKLNLTTDSINPEVLIPQLFNFRLHLDTPAHTKYGDIVEMYEDATTEEEETAAQEEATGYSLTYMDQVGSGPFDIVDDSQDRFIAEPSQGHPAWAHNGGHPMTDWAMNFKECHIMYRSPDVNQGVMVENEQVIAENGPTQTSFYDNLNEDKFDIWEYPGYKGHGLKLNNRADEYFGNGALHRAIQYAINTKNLAENIGRQKFPVEIPHGFKTNVQGDPTDFISQEVLDGMNNYNWNENDFESAAEEMRASGAEQDDDGAWLHPDTGEQISFEIQVPPWDGYAISHETVSQKLTEFGFDVNQLNVEAQVWFEELSGEWDWTAYNWFWGGEPTNARTFQHLAQNTMPEGGEPGAATGEVPWPPGDADGDMKEVDMAEFLKEYRTATDSDASQEALEKLSWSYNYLLPMNPYTERRKFMIENTRVANWPSNDHLVRGHPRWMSICYKYGIPETTGKQPEGV